MPIKGQKWDKNKVSVITKSRHYFCLKLKMITFGLLTFCQHCITGKIIAKTALTSQIGVVFNLKYLLDGLITDEFKVYKDIYETKQVEYINLE